MTVMTKFYDYQAAGTSSPYYNKGEAPAIQSLQDYILPRYGGQDLGSFGIRNVRGGTSISTHASGAAWDWRYEGPGPGRPVLLNEIIPYLLNSSAELGIQAIHDYVGGRIWRSDRPGTVNDQAWVPQTIRGDMGASWAKWIHIEIHPDNWQDGRPVPEKLGLVGGPIEFPPFIPEWGLFSLYPYATNKSTIQIGAKGDLVKYLQGVLRHKLNYAIGIDGDFGATTKNFVIWFQNTNGLLGDGIVGPKTWAKIDALAK